MVKKLYRFYEYCNRMGSLEGVFISSPHMINKIIGKQVNFYEVLGKHSDIWVDIKNTNFEMLTDDPKFIELFEDKIGQVGVNPFDHYEFDLEEEYNEQEKVVISEDFMKMVEAYYYESKRSRKN